MTLHLWIWGPASSWMLCFCLAGVSDDSLLCPVSHTATVRRTPPSCGLEWASASASSRLAASGGTVRCPGWLEGREKVTWWQITLAFATRKSFCASHLYPSCCLEIPSTHKSLCGAPSDSSKLLSLMLPLSPGLLFFGATRSLSFHCLLGKGSVIIF